MRKELFNAIRAKLAETVPLARDELTNGLYQVISNGMPLDTPPHGVAMMQT